MATATLTATSTTVYEIVNKNRLLLQQKQVCRI